MARVALAMLPHLGSQSPTLKPELEGVADDLGSPASIGCASLVDGRQEGRVESHGDGGRHTDCST